MDFALKQLVEKAESYTKTMCDLKSWYDGADKALLPENMKKHMKTYNTEFHDMLCAGVGNFTKKHVDLNEDVKNKKKIDSLLMCMRQLQSKLPDVKQASAFVRISGQLISGIEAVKKSSKHMEIFFGKARPRSSTKGKRPVSSVQGGRGGPSHGKEKAAVTQPKVDKNKQGKCGNCEELTQNFKTKNLEVLHLHKRVTKLENHLRSSNEECSRLTSENILLQECLDKLERPKDQRSLMASFSSDKLLKTKEKHIEDLKEGHDKELEYRDKMIQRMRDEIENLTHRLSAEMGKKVSSDESSVENISIKNRPMVIAEDYYNFCSNAWLDAKTLLDERCKGQTEKEALQFLNSILEMSYNKTVKAFADVFRTMNMQISHPGVAITSDIPVLGPDKLPKEVSVVVGDYIRVNSDRTDLSALLVEIVNTLKEKYPKFKKVTDEKEIIDYIKEALLIGWKMAIQRPPMEFRWAGLGKAWQEQLQEPYWRCDPYTEGATVQYYIHPSLHHGGAILVKGKIFID